MDMRVSAWGRKAKEKPGRDLNVEVEELLSGEQVPMPGEAEHEDLQGDIVAWMDAQDLAGGGQDDARHEHAILELETLAEDASLLPSMDIHEEEFGL